MHKFKAHLIIEFESPTIQEARKELKEITEDIWGEIPHIKKISLDKCENLFDKNDLKWQNAKIVGDISGEE